MADDFYCPLCNNVVGDYDTSTVFVSIDVTDFRNTQDKTLKGRTIRSVQFHGHCYDAVKHNYGHLLGRSG